MRLSGGVYPLKMPLRQNLLMAPQSGTAPITRKQDHTVESSALIYAWHGASGIEHQSSGSERPRSRADFPEDIALLFSIL
jgi:hypothetical protein